MVIHRDHISSYCEGSRIMSVHVGYKSSHNYVFLHKKTLYSPFQGCTVLKKQSTVSEFCWRAWLWGYIREEGGATVVRWRLEHLLGHWLTTTVKLSSRGCLLMEYLSLATCQSNVMQTLFNCEQIAPLPSIGVRHCAELLTSHGAVAPTLMICIWNTLWVALSCKTDRYC